MAKTILATFGGNDYQARIFWYQACQMLYSESKIEKVGFEIEKFRFFDDVVTIYKSPILDEHNEPVMADYWQVKYHVDFSGVLTCEQLVNPEFINSKASSILQRLHQLQLELAPDGSGVRFYFVSPWHVQHDDPLAKLISNNGGELRLDVLFSTSAVMRRVRETWKNHLNISSDKELGYVVKPLRILVGHPPLQQLRNYLNGHLVSVGLKRVDEAAMSNPYDDLIRKVRAAGQFWFSGSDILEICKHDNLWMSKEKAPDQVTRLGIRSFMRWAENMENETHRMVNLVPLFDGRSIRAPKFWQEEVYQQTENFLQEALQERVLYSLRLDCHSSIAFAAGYIVGTKSGFEVAPLQKTSLGQSLWRLKNTPKSSVDLWSIESYKVNESEREVALALSITHSIINDVQEYASCYLPAVSRIIACQLHAGMGSKAIEDGAHAYILVQQLVQWLRQNRSKYEKQAILHIFGAAPNGFMFYLGQQSRALGLIQLYEHDFDNPEKNNYQPSLKFPK